MLDVLQVALHERDPPAVGRPRRRVHLIAVRDETRRSAVQRRRVQRVVRHVRERRPSGATVTPRSRCVPATRSRGAPPSADTTSMPRGDTNRSRWRVGKPRGPAPTHVLGANHLNGRAALDLAHRQRAPSRPNTPRAFRRARAPGRARARDPSVTAVRRPSRMGAGARRIASTTPMTATATRQPRPANGTQRRRPGDLAGSPALVARSSRVASALRRTPTPWRSDRPVSSRARAGARRRHPAGTSARSWVIRVASPSRAGAPRSPRSGPVNGGCPASISYSTQPSAYRSLRPSSSRSPAACSGLMYAGVPIATPVPVSCSPARAVDRPRDAEVGDERVPALEQDVLGLDVAVDDAARVRVARARRRPRGRSAARRRPGAASRGRAGRAATRPRRTASRSTGRPSASPESYSGRMCGCCRLAVVWISRRNRSAPMRGGELGPEHLDGDLAVVLEVVGEVDRGHAARAELALDAVAVREGGAQSGAGSAIKLGDGRYSSSGAGSR